MLLNLLLGLVYFVLGLALMEAGILSILVAAAYSDLKGSAIPAVAGTLLVLCGGYAVARAKRRIFREKRN